MQTFQKIGIATNKLSCLYTNKNYYIDDFISFIEKEDKEDKYDQKTTIIVITDHIAMNYATTIKKLRQLPRKPIFMTNRTLAELNLKKNQTFNQYHIPQITLSALGVKHNAQFFAQHSNLDLNNHALLESKMLSFTQLNLLLHKTF